MVTRVPFRISCMHFKSSAHLLKRTWRHFPTARQSGDLRAGRQADRSAGACRLTCAPEARQGPIAAATGPRWQAPEHQQAPHQLQPLERPQGTAEAWRTSTAQPSGPISPLQCLGGRQPGWQVPFGFRIPGA